MTDPNKPANKDKILQAAKELIREKGNDPDSITMREISQRAKVGLGLINYHFQSREQLLEAAVQQMVNEVVHNFQGFRDKIESDNPVAALEILGNLTFDFLFENETLARISILSDMNHPDANDNTTRTWKAYLPLVAAARADWPDHKVKTKTLELITTMQNAFLRSTVIRETLNVDLRKQEERRAFHKAVLSDLLEVEL